MTSHYRLVIHNEDAYAPEWLIIVSAVAGKFYFKYLMPKEKAPWEGAYVRGMAKSLEEVRKFFLIAMRECGGWQDNIELKQRLNEVNL